MKLLDIMESGIAHWTVDPDLDQNEQEMMSKFMGYDREMRHYTQKEKRTIRDDSFVKKVSNSFSKCPVPFSLYFWHTQEPDYDKTAFKGIVDDQWLAERLGRNAYENIKAQTSSNAITIVLTNNLSDENKVSLTSPWIVAHRIAHAMVGDSDTNEAYRIRNLMKNFLRQILTVGYGCEWPDENSQHGRIFSNDYHEIYGKLMGTMLGTMASARNAKITSVYEWWYETVTQFIVKGKITFNALPDHFDDDLDLTDDPNKRQMAIKMWGQLPTRLERAITHLLEQGRGKVFVV